MAQNPRLQAPHTPWSEVPHEGPLTSIPCPTNKEGGYRLATTRLPPGYHWQPPPSICRVEGKGLGHQVAQALQPKL